ncbi:ABC transporter permease [Cutibacterium equinum]|uniref:ABC transporter permease n=1 Tax=Cutibacterium equinum TaxID=3016342 RepID=A0ABY7QXN4_9ACTN|nr:ABC transporter permease [Cutibacterium equinum]WCC79169.1 ABC transporter permease [Cutibacterium equinum]
MFKYLAKRAVTYLVMAYLATTAAYFLACSYFRPGNLMLDRTPRPTPEQVQHSLATLGLDPTKSVPERYWEWLKGVVLHWDWGRSPDATFVNVEFSHRVWISFALQIVSIILTLVIGIALGVISATHQYSVADRVITGWSYLTYILPAPVAYLLVQLGAIAINQASGSQVFFVTGTYDPTVVGFWPRALDLIKHYIVPTVAMTIFGWAGYQVGQRQYLLDNIATDFVRTARATGLTRSQAIRRHALRVSFIPVAQSIAFTIPAVFTGSFFAESIFNWQGLGMWSIAAIAKQDVNVAVAMVAYGAIVFAVGALLADFSITLVDPRVRFTS